MRSLIWPVTLVAATTIQASLAPLIAVNGVWPDFMLLIALSTGLLGGRSRGVAAGFFGGLLQDLLSGGIFGINTLPKAAVGYLAGMAERKVFKDNLLLPPAAAVCATAAGHSATVALLYFFGQNVGLADYLMFTLLPLTVYHAVVALPVHLAVRRLLRFIDG